MTPDELRALADEATPGPWEIYSEHPTWARTASNTWAAVLVHTEDANSLNAVDARLIALAPDLARLCAELGEVCADILNDGKFKEERATYALAKLSELQPC